MLLDALLLDALLLDALLLDALLLDALLLDPFPVAICSARKIPEMFEEPVLAEANHLPEFMKS